MKLNALFDQRPSLVALAGPNGAGKSSYYAEHVSQTSLQFVNADVIAQSMEMDAYAAVKWANSFRRQLVEQRESFVFETVFSDPVGDELEFLKSVEEAGYFVLLIFIGIDDPSLSADRVAMRVSQGGHDVPKDKMAERYPRILKNLRRALAELGNVWVYDHSDLDAGYRLVATRENGQPVELRGPVPAWLRPLLPGT